MVSLDVVLNDMQGVQKIMECKIVAVIGCILSYLLGITSAIEYRRLKDKENELRK